MGPAAGAAPVHSSEADPMLSLEREPANGGLAVVTSVVRTFLGRLPGDRGPFGTRAEGSGVGRALRAPCRAFGDRRGHYREPRAQKSFSRTSL